MVCVRVRLGGGGWLSVVVECITWSQNVLTDMHDDTLQPRTWCWAVASWAGESMRMSGRRGRVRAAAAPVAARAGNDCWVELDTGCERPVVK